MGYSACHQVSNEISPCPRRPCGTHLEPILVASGAAFSEGQEVGLVREYLLEVVVSRGLVVIHSVGCNQRELDPVRNISKSGRDWNRASNLIGELMGFIVSPTQVLYLFYEWVQSWRDCDQSTIGVVASYRFLGATNQRPQQRRISGYDRFFFS